MFFFKNFALANYNKVFYDLQINSISGELIDFKKYKGKAILIVNTASYCGFTKQYEGLQKLWEKYESKGLVVLGIPSDSFNHCLLYTSPSPRDGTKSRMPSSA